MKNQSVDLGQIPGRWGTAHASIVPYQTFKTAGSKLKPLKTAGSNLNPLKINNRFKTFSI